MWKSAHEERVQKQDSVKKKKSGGSGKPSGGQKAALEANCGATFLWGLVKAE